MVGEIYYGISAPSKTTICRWFRELKYDRTNTDDAPRPGRPNEAVTSENAKKIHQIILNDRKVKVRETADIVKISTKERFTWIRCKCLQPFTATGA